MSIPPGHGIHSRRRRNGALAALGAARVIAVGAYRLSARDPSRLPVVAEEQRSFAVSRTAAVCATMEVQRLCKGRKITRLYGKVTGSRRRNQPFLFLPLDGSVMDERPTEGSEHNA